MLTTVNAPTQGHPDTKAEADQPTLLPGEPPAFRVYMVTAGRTVQSFGLNHAQAIVNAIAQRHPEDVAAETEADYRRRLRVYQLGCASRADFIELAKYGLDAAQELAQLAMAEGWSDVDQTPYLDYLHDVRPAAVAFG